MALLADTPVALPVSAPQDAYNNYEQRPLHSPPQATPSSYGNAMPKRARAGSVSRSRTNSVDLSLSSRLRSASELEKAGVVSSTQKGALKDLIIFGDEALRGALDDYQQGDAERLERLVKQGYLDRSRGVNVSTVESRPREGSIDLLAELDLDSTAEVLFAARRPPPSAELFSTDDQLMGFDMEMPTLSTGLLGEDDLFSERKRRARLGSVGSFGSARSDDGGRPRPRCDSLASEPEVEEPPPQQRTQRTAARHALSGAPKRRSRRDDRPRASDAHPGPDQPVARFRGTVAATVADPPGARLLDPGPAPAYELLVNFPRAKSRTQLHCVMCGRRPRDANPREPLPERAPPQPRNPRLDGMGDDRDDVQPGSERTLGGSVIIPRQNKDVCRECDKALWRHCASDIHFKWCKGCKRFRNLVAFAEKLAASKCDRCRERGRQGYMRRKGGGPSPPTSPRH